MFQDLQDYASENYIVLQPDYILTDFEQAAICAVKQEFINSQSRLCLFHLGQSMWRKVQSVGLSIKYGEDEEFSLLVRHLLALAFLPPEEIPSAFDEIKKLLEIESGTENLIMWFEDNYVLGRVRKTLRNGNVIRGLPLFSPELWSVFNQNIPRTQNNIEAWHRRWECLVGESHVGVYHLIK
ncbi:MULE domain-containing protein, partial [Aphis craccivora]